MSRAGQWSNRRSGTGGTLQPLSQYAVSCTLHKAALCICSRFYLYHRWTVYILQQCEQTRGSPLKDTTWNPLVSVWRITGNTAWQLVGVDVKRTRKKTDKMVNSKLVCRQGEASPHFYEIRQSRQAELHRRAYKELCVAWTEHLLNPQCLKLACFHPPLWSWWVGDVVHSLEERTVKSPADQWP